MAKHLRLTNGTEIDMTLPSRWGAVCALIFSACVWAQVPTTVLKGRVVDATNAAVAKASVEIKEVTSGHTIRMESGDDGTFTASELTPGRYRLVVQRAGMETKSQEVVLAAGQNPEISVTLHPSKVATSVDIVESIANIQGNATKSEIPILETPQSISLISRDTLVQQAPLTMQDALRYTAGVRAEQYGYDSRGDWASIRGGGFGQYMNGMRMLFGSYNNVRPDPFALEQIEVMKGPSSILFGQGGFGGVINLVTKRPQPVHRGEVSVQLGMYNRKQLGFDVTGPVDDDRKLLYRVVGVGRDSNTQVNYVPDDRLLLAPSLTWRPREGTNLTILTNFQNDKSGSSVAFFPWQGTLLPAPFGQIPTSTFISEPGFDDYSTTQKAVGYLFEQRFGDTWTVRQNFNYSHSSANYQSIYSRFGPLPTLNPDGRTIHRTIYISKPSLNTPTVDTNVQTKFRTGFIRHIFLAGVDFQQASITSRQISGTAPAIDVYAPVYGNYTPLVPVGMPKNVQRQTGLYAQDQLKFGEHWSALAGIRKDWAFAETIGNSASRLDTTATTGRLGLVYTTNFGLAPYFSYTSSFLPIAGVNFYNEPYKPQTGKQWEAGMKFEPANGRGMVSFALYDLRETNRRTPDPANPQNSVQLGEVQSRGAEFEARTKVPGQIDLIATYTYNLARITKSNSTDLGKRLATMPLHLTSVWANKRFRLGSRGWLTAGPGIRYTGSTFDGIDVLRTPAYTLFDGMAAYETSSWRFSVNAANIADKIIVSTCLARGDCYYGMRRTVTGTVSYRF